MVKRNYFSFGACQGYRFLLILVQQPEKILARLWETEADVWSALPLSLAPRQIQTNPSKARP
jgi:hypothetical protein